MPLLIGDTVSKRKKCLAELVEKHLNAIGHKAKLIERRANSAGHTDRVLIESDLGFIHLTASSNLQPNERIRTARYKDGDQAFLADKAYVAYGWNTEDDRTLIMFVSAGAIKGKVALTKTEIEKLSDQNLNAVLY